MEYTVNKSYVIVDTPVNCGACELSYCDSYGDVCCPLLQEGVVPNTYDSRHEKCPLKTIRIVADIQI